MFVNEQDQYITIQELCTRDNSPIPFIGLAMGGLGGWPLVHRRFQWGNLCLPNQTVVVATSSLFSGS